MKKTTANDEMITHLQRHVTCPYCHTELVGVVAYAVVIECWHCKKEFRIDDDPDNWGDEKKPDSTDPKPRRIIQKFSMVKE
jgi:DNA-directed RNA polymerase subunit RPC12/RpoP